MHAGAIDGRAVVLLLYNTQQLYHPLAISRLTECYLLAHLSEACETITP